jgi:hypothetical protein
MKGFALVHIIQTLSESTPSLESAWRDNLPLEWNRETDKRVVNHLSWVPIEYYYDAVTFLSSQSGALNPRHAIDVGYAMATLDIGAFFRLALAVASPISIMKISGRFWRNYFNTSDLLVVSASRNSVCAEVRNWPLPQEAALYEIAGSLVAWMEAGRAKEVRVSELEWTRNATLKIVANWT